jgi:dienelactone hydrolase
LYWGQNDSTIVTLAIQSYGAVECISKLKQGVSTLFIYGTHDKFLPVYCSQQVYRHVHEPKKIILYKGAGHGFDEVSEEVYDQIKFIFGLQRIFFLFLPLDPG